MVYKMLGELGLAARGSQERICIGSESSGLKSPGLGPILTVAGQKLWVVQLKDPLKRSEKDLKSSLQVLILRTQTCISGS